MDREFRRLVFFGDLFQMSSGRGSFSNLFWATFKYLKLHRVNISGGRDVRQLCDISIRVKAPNAKTFDLGCSFNFGLHWRTASLNQLIRIVFNWQLLLCQFIIVAVFGKRELYVTDEDERNE